MPSNPGRLLRSSFFSVVATVGLGGVSLLILTSGARHVEAERMAHFISQWVIVNTVVVAVGSAFDQLGPRLQTQIPKVSRALLSHATLLPLCGSMAAFGFLLAIRSPGLPVLPVMAYCMSTALWAGHRSLCLSLGRFRSLAFGAVGMLVVCGGVIVWMVWRNSISPAVLFWAASLAFLAGWIVLVISSPAGTRLPVSRERLPRAEYLLAISIVVTAAGSLLLSSGGMAFATNWGVQPGRIVSYAAILNLVRIPSFVLGSILAPLNLDIARSVASGEREVALKMTLRSMGLVLAGGILISSTLALAGPTIITTLFGDQVRFEIGLMLAVVGVEGLLLVAAAMAAFFIGSGRSRLLTTNWLLGCGVFAILASLARIGDDRLYLAPLSGAVTIALLLLLRLVLERSVQDTVGQAVN